MPRLTAEQKKKKAEKKAEKKAAEDAVIEAAQIKDAEMRRNKEEMLADLDSLPMVRTLFDTVGAGDWEPARGVAENWYIRKLVAAIIRERYSSEYKMKLFEFAISTEYFYRDVKSLLDQSVRDTKYKPYLDQERYINELNDDYREQVELCKLIARQYVTPEGLKIPEFQNYRIFLH